jgi:hypothetical protein
VKNDTNNVICNYLILQGYCKQRLEDYNAKVLLSAFELIRNSNRLSVESFQFIIESLLDVDKDADKMLEKARYLHSKYKGLMKGEVGLVEDFVKDLFK